MRSSQNVQNESDIAVKFNRPTLYLPFAGPWGCAAALAARPRLAVRTSTHGTPVTCSTSQASAWQRNGTRLEFSSVNAGFISHKVDVKEKIETTLLRNVGRSVLHPRHPSPPTQHAIIMPCSTPTRSPSTHLAVKTCLRNMTACSCERVTR